MGTPLSVDALKPVAPVFSGHARLMEDIESQRTVFCICIAARDYHMGVGDARLIFQQQSEYRRLQLVEDTSTSAESAKENVYIPTEPALPEESIGDQIKQTRQAVHRTYEFLKQAYPQYKAGVRLRDQEATIRPRIIKAFSKLSRAGILPITTGNSIYNHQGLTILMEQCFHEKDQFVSYLQNPDLLNIPSELEEIAVPSNSASSMLTQTLEKRLLASTLLDDNGFGLNLLLELHKNNQIDWNRPGPEIKKVSYTLAQFVSAKIVAADKGSFTITQYGRYILKRIKDEISVQS